jgi:hypothetical protein
LGGRTKACAAAVLVVGEHKPQAFQNVSSEIFVHQMQIEVDVSGEWMVLDPQNWKKFTPKLAFCTRSCGSQR